MPNVTPQFLIDYKCQVITLISGLILRYFMYLEQLLTTVAYSGRELGLRLNLSDHVKLVIYKV